MDRTAGGETGILSTLQALRTTESEHLLLLSAAQNRLTEIDRQVKEVEKTIKNDVQTMDNPARQELQNQLMQRQKRLTEMLVNYTEDHPQVKAIREEIATLEAQLKDTPERVPGTIHETINPRVPATRPGPDDRGAGSQGPGGLASRDPGADHGE